ncbi:MAG: Ig-like domain-containing protein [Acidimicrobiia bacterium]
MESLRGSAGGPTAAMRVRWAVGLALFALIASSCGVFTHGGNTGRTAWYADQTGLTPQLVSGGTFGQMFQSPVDGQVYAQPVISNGTVLVATEKNNIYGIDAITGARSWSRNVGVPWNPNDVACADLTPSVGITSTPTIDPVTNTAYFFDKTYASGTTGPAAWFAHAIDVGTGAERAGFPVRIQGTAANDPGKVFNATDALQRTGLLLLNGVVYAGFGGHCDHQPYSGWVVGLSTTGAIRTMWTSAPGDTGAAGIWQSGGGLIEDGPDSIILATGNGSTNVTARPGSQPGSSLGQAVVRLKVQPDGSLQAVDFFSPYDADTLDTWDADLASGGPVMLPSTPFSTPAHPRLVAIAGKQGFLYLLDPADLGGMKQGPNGGDRVVARFGPFGGVWGQVAAWPGDGGYLYLLPPTTFVGDGYVRVLKWGIDGAGKPSLAEVGRTTETAGVGSTAAVVTSDGTTSGTGLLWVQSRDGSGNGQLRAYDLVPVNGRLVLRWSGSLGRSTKYSLPTVLNERVYVGTEDGRLLSFGSPVTQPLTGGPLAIPNTPVGQATTANLTLRATTDLTISSIATGNPAFTTGTPTATNPTRSGLPMSVPLGQTVTIPVRFAPTTAGAASSEITLATSVRTISIPVTSTGINPTGLLRATPPVISFGGAPAGGTPVSAAVSIANVGATGVTITGTTPPVAPFAVTGLPAVGSVVAPLSSVVVSATFAPTVIGQYTSTLALSTSAGPLEIPFSGTSAPPPVMTLNPTTVPFGSTLLGATAARTFTVKNSGGSPLQITKSKPPAAGLGFAATTAIPEASVIPVGATVTETVTFTPTVTGAVSDTWILNGNDGGGERAITFTGTGVAGTTVASPITGTWTKNGSATQGPEWLDLTGLATNARGSSFAPQPITASSIAVSFDTFIGYGTGADGMAVVLGDVARGATGSSLGAAGGGLGFAGIPGIAVAMDTFQNPGDPSGNSVGITNGPVGSDPVQLRWLATTSAVPLLRTFVHHVVVSVVSGYVAVRIDGQQVLGQPGVAVPGTFRLGFSGGSGGLTDLHMVNNVTITTRT